jgi:hypothetical protein
MYDETGKLMISVETVTHFVIVLNFIVNLDQF